MPHAGHEAGRCGARRRVEHSTCAVHTPVTRLAWQRPVCSSARTPPGLCVRRAYGAHRCSSAHMRCRSRVRAASSSLQRCACSPLAWACSVSRSACAASSRASCHPQQACQTLPPTSASMRCARWDCGARSSAHVPLMRELMLMSYRAMLSCTCKSYLFTWTQLCAPAQAQLILLAGLTPATLAYLQRRTAAPAPPERAPPSCQQTRLQAACSSRRKPAPDSEQGSDAPRWRAGHSPAPTLPRAALPARRARRPWPPPARARPQPAPPRAPPPRSRARAPAPPPTRARAPPRRSPAGALRGRRRVSSRLACRVPCSRRHGVITAGRKAGWRNVCCHGVAQWLKAAAHRPQPACRPWLFQSP